MTLNPFEFWRRHRRNKQLKKAGTALLLVASIMALTREKK
jgi:hypothetical protein